MGVGGGCAGMRRECLRVIVVVDIEKSSTSGTLPSMRHYICLTLHLSNFTVWDFFKLFFGRWPQIAAQGECRSLYQVIYVVSCCFVSALALLSQQLSSLLVYLPPPSSSYSNCRPSPEFRFHVASAILMCCPHPISSDPTPLPGWGDPAVVPDCFVDSVGKSNLSI
jgi:hypothetical protein